MSIQLLMVAIWVAVVWAVARVISWTLGRLGAKPSFIACVVITICLLSMVSTNVAMFIAAKSARLDGSDKAVEAPQAPVPIAEVTV
jgi:hypothetical protein